MKYVMFLRGINVGGIRVPMPALKECLAAIGLKNIKTYLQSGNVEFESSDSEAALKPLVEKTLSSVFHYDAYVLLFPFSYIKEVVEGYPFKTDENSHRYALFCDSEDVKNELNAYANALDPAIEEIVQGKSVIYWRAPKGSSSDTVFSKIIAKTKYKAVTTNRNLNTLERMIR